VHEIDGKKRKVYVHRKGATRAFGPGRDEVPGQYRDVGQPVIIPGNMGAPSYILVGTDTAMKETFGSTCHGAGRILSRAAAKRKFVVSDIIKGLAEKGIYVKAASKPVIAEESPGAYKNPDEVVKSTQGAGISRMIVKLRPVGVAKG